MQEPPRYETGEVGLVKRLLKVLYSLKQARRKWYDVLHTVVTDLGFRVSKSRPQGIHCLHQKNILILVHVDDCAMTATRQSSYCCTRKASHSVCTHRP